MTGRLKPKHQRLVLVVIALVAILVAGVVAAWALRNQASYFYLPEQMRVRREKLDRLRAAGRNPMRVQEPGGTRIGLEIRKILLDKANIELDPMADRYTLEVSSPGRYRVGAMHPTGAQATSVVVEVRDTIRHALYCKTGRSGIRLRLSRNADSVSEITGPSTARPDELCDERPDPGRAEDPASPEGKRFPSSSRIRRGGEIRDRIGGGKAAQPLAGTAVYMTSYPRLEGGRNWEKATEERDWLYQTPEEILIKASNGASDFGDHFGSY